jgi:hypothetical protein
VRPTGRTGYSVRPSAPALTQARLDRGDYLLAAVAGTVRITRIALIRKDYGEHQRDVGNTSSASCPKGAAAERCSQGDIPLTRLGGRERDRHFDPPVDDPFGRVPDRGFLVDGEVRQPREDLGDHLGPDCPGDVTPEAPVRADTECHVAVRRSVEDHLLGVLEHLRVEIRGRVRGPDAVVQPELRFAEGAGRGDGPRRSLWPS